jgi:FAD dependent oxidoreductase
MNTAPLDVLVVGASLGGVIAAWRSAQAGLRTGLVAEYPWLGGQMSAQAVPPDEHRWVEDIGVTQSYRAFREAIRSHYRAQDGFCDQATMTAGTNPGDGWVSRLCFEPALAHEYFTQLLAPFVASGRLTIHAQGRLLQVERQGRSIKRVQLHGPVGPHWIEAHYFLDATDTGELIAKAGLAYRLGKEARHEFGEIDAPITADPLDQQPVTAVIALRWRAQGRGVPIIKPEGYDAWANHVLPHYGHRLFSNFIPGARRGLSVALPFFATGTTLDLWRYRRIIAAHQWATPRAEVSLINWAQNDYNRQPLLDGPCSQDEIEAAARALSQAFAWWLQNAAPHGDGTGVGYSQLELAPDITATSDGLAQQVYVRESRRIVALQTLSQNDIIQGDAGELSPVNRSDSVGTVSYNMDIHPTCISGHGINAHARPFTLPVGCFVPIDCDNLIPACKNIGVTHLVNAATRVHPAEWLIGEVAATLAAQALATGLTPAALAQSPRERATLQTTLQGLGIPLAWPDPLPQSQ